MQKLTVLSVAYPLTEVSADAVGGSEQVLAQIDRALTAAGHRSLVVASEDSRVAGTLIASPKGGKHLNDGVRERGRQVHRQLINEVLAKHSVDLIHMHSLDFHTYLPASAEPVLATLHLPPDWYPPHVFDSTWHRVQINCVSGSQRLLCPPGSSPFRIIPNGVDVERLQLQAPKQDYVVAMGRICPEKGFHFALDAARIARIPLKLAGQVFPYALHRRYFRREIATRLDGEREFVGPLQFEAKRRLLTSARGLIVSSTVAETSSLVAMEALACGTPVFAFRTGALPEIVDDGKTGYLVSDVREMAEALQRVDGLDPAACRDAARARFSSGRMTGNYLDLYQELARSVPARIAPGKAESWVA